MQKWKIELMATLTYGRDSVDEKNDVDIFYPPLEPLFIKKAIVEHF